MVENMIGGIFPGPWKDAALNGEEVRRIVSAFLSNPSREGRGATADEILQVIRWAKELKSKAALNVNILRMIYIGQMGLDVNDQGEIITGILSGEAPAVSTPVAIAIEGWLDL